MAAGTQSTGRNTELIIDLTIAIIIEPIAYLGRRHRDLPTGILQHTTLTNALSRALTHTAPTLGRGHFEVFIGPSIAVAILSIADILPDFHLQRDTRVCDLTIDTARLAFGPADAETAACHRAKEGFIDLPIAIIVVAIADIVAKLAFAKDAIGTDLARPIAVWIVRTWPLFPIAALSNGDVRYTTIDHHGLVGPNRAVWHGGLSIRPPTIGGRFRCVVRFVHRITNEAILHVGVQFSGPTGLAAARNEAAYKAYKKKNTYLAESDHSVFNSSFEASILRAPLNLQQQIIRLYHRWQGAWQGCIVID